MKRTFPGAESSVGRRMGYAPQNAVQQLSPKCGGGGVKMCESGPRLQVCTRPLTRNQGVIMLSCYLAVPRRLPTALARYPKRRLKVMRWLARSGQTSGPFSTTRTIRNPVIDSGQRHKRGMLHAGIDLYILHEGLRKKLINFIWQAIDSYMWEDTASSSRPSHPFAFFSNCFPNGGRLINGGAPKVIMCLTHSKCTFAYEDKILEGLIHILLPFRKSDWAHGRRKEEEATLHKQNSVPCRLFPGTQTGGLWQQWTMHSTDQNII